MEKEATQERPKEPKREKEKILKLTYKEKIALEALPQEIEKLEEQIEQMNICLADPSCYEEKGITALAAELSELEEAYEIKVEELLTIEEKVETINEQG